MKKTMTRWQMIMGLVLCALLTLSVFMPRVTIDVGKATEGLADTLIGKLGGIAGELGVSQDELDDVIGGLDDEVKELRDDAPKVHISSFALITANKQDLEEWMSLMDGYDMIDNLTVSNDETNMLIFIRLVMLFIYLYPLILIGRIIAVYVKKTGRTSAAVIGIIYGVLIAMGYIFWYGILPDAIVKSAGGGFIDQSLASTAVAVVRKVLMMLSGTGVYAHIALTLLIFIWSILLLALPASQTASAPFYDVSGGQELTGVGMPESAFDPAPLGGMISGSEELPLGNPMPMGGVVSGSGELPIGNPVPMGGVISGSDELPLGNSMPMGGAVSGSDESLIGNTIPMGGLMLGGVSAPQKSGVICGTILGIAGCLAGASIPLQNGESVIIGREPSVSQLILNNPKVSRTHCTVRLDDSGNFYHIECHSKNGLVLSDGQMLQAGQRTQAGKGCRLNFAQGMEVLQLG